jgi:hypothetical protein
MQSKSEIYNSESRSDSFNSKVPSLQLNFMAERPQLINHLKKNVIMGSPSGHGHITQASDQSPFHNPNKDISLSSSKRTS